MGCRFRGHVAYDDAYRAGRLRDIPGADGTILGQIAYGWKNGYQTWRTSAVVELHEISGPHKILETRNTFYTLVGDEATDEQRTALYNVVF